MLAFDLVPRTRSEWAHGRARPGAYLDEEELAADSAEDRRTRGELLPWQRGPGGCPKGTSHPNLCGYLGSLRPNPKRPVPKGMGIIRLRISVTRY